MAANVNSVDRLELVHRGGTGVSPVIQAQDARDTCHLIKIKLEFIKPFAATNATDFSFAPQGNQTNVKWTMSGDNNFMGKAFGLFMNMDKMVGGDFEKGLAQLKSVAETASKQ